MSSRERFASRATKRRGDAGRGSLRKGVALFVLCLFGGGLLAWRLAAKLAVAYAGASEAGHIYPALASLPLLFALFLGLGLAWTGKTRTAFGMLLGFGIAAALGLLLIVVCGWLMAGPGRLQY